jgi:hypothetical protein
MFKAFLNFDIFIYPRIVRVIYWIGLILIVVLTLGAVVGALVAGSSPMMRGSGYNSGLALLLALVGGFAAIVVWRISVELWLVIFSIHDLLKEIRDNTRRP